MKPTAVSQIAEQIVRVSIALPLAFISMHYSNGNIVTSVAFTTLGTSFGAMVTVIILERIYRKGRKVRFSEFRKQDRSIPKLRIKTASKKILQYSIPITLCVGLTHAGTLIDQWNIKVRLLAAGFDEDRASTLHGYLVTAQQVINVPIAISVAIAVATLPAISAALARKNTEELMTKIHFVFKVCFIIAIPCAVGIAALSPYVSTVFQFRDAYNILALSALLIVLMSVMQIQAAILQGLQKMYAVTFFIIGGLVAKIVANYFLIVIPEINIYGALIGSVISFIIPIVLSNILMKRTIQTRFRLLSHAVRPLLAAGGMGIIVFALGRIFELIFNRDAHLGFSRYAIDVTVITVSVLAGAIVYFALLIVLRGLTQNEFDTLPNKLTRRIPKQIMRKIERYLV